MKKINLVISFFILALFTVNTMAQTPEEQGREIAVEAKKRDTGWNDNKSVSKMILRNKQGQESVRVLRQNNFEVNQEGLGDKSVVVFEEPFVSSVLTLLVH